MNHDPVARSADTTSAQPVRADAAVEQPGDRIGHYKLLQKIGEGGFGVVWMAEQEEPVRRKVALKVLKAGMDTAQVVARFEAERQALALMDHPNIAKVFDGGATSTGRPYFVMELVKGVPITQFCDDAGMGMVERLQLFVPVCQAVQHAHQKGVIHRDLKPSNVLVTLHDGTPVCKVIDFGIAKATAGSLTQKTVFTEFRQLLGTPEYMAPEQAELSSLDVDTRADIYSLGVLLYELLTGTRPFEMKTLLQAGYAEMLRTIKEVDPPKPSTRISTLGEQLIDICKHRRVTPRAFGSLMRGDLDWIVMKAIEKERSRRYDTATALAEDVLRHLRHEPVLASPPSRLYRFRKYARRHRVGIVAATLVTAALVVGTLGTTIGLLQASDERDRARTAEQQHVQLRLAAEAAATSEAQQRLAAEQARTAEAEQRQLAERSAADALAEWRSAGRITAFLGKMLAGVAPSVALGRDTTLLREALDEAASRLRRGGLADSAVAESTLQARIGEVYLAIGQPEAAAHLLEPAWATVRRLHPGDHLAVREIQHLLAELARVRGDLNEARVMASAAEAMGSRLRPEGDTRQVRLLSALASIEKGLGNQQVAAQRAREAVALVRRLPRESHMLAPTLCALARVLGSGSPEEAGAAAQEALAVARGEHAGDHAAIVEALSELAKLQCMRGNLQEAEDCAREAVVMLGRISAPTDASRGVAAGVLGGVLLHRGKDDEAADCLAAALAARRRQFAGDHELVVAACLDLADVHLRRGDTAAAATLIDEARGMCGRLFQGDHRATARMLHGEGIVCERRGDLRTAELRLRDAVAMLQRLVPGGDDGLLAAMGELGTFLADHGKTREGVAMLREALALRSRLDPGDQPHVATKARELGVRLQRLGDYAAAEPLLRQALAMRERLLPAVADAVAESRTDLGVLLQARGDLSGAETLLQRAVASYDALDDAQRRREAWYALSALAQVESELGASDTATALARRTVALIEAEAGPSADQHMVLANCLVVLAEYDSSAEGVAVAEARLRRAIALFGESLGHEHPNTLTASRRLGERLYERGEFAAAEACLDEVRVRGGEAWARGVLPTLGMCMLRQGRPAEAEVLLQDALRSATGETRDRLLGVLVLALLQQEKGAEAEPLARECFEARSRTMRGHWACLAAMSHLGEALRQQGSLAEAEHLLRESAERMPQEPPRRYLRDLAIRRYCQWLEQRGRTAEADDWRRRLSDAPK